MKTAYAGLTLILLTSATLAAETVLPDWTIGSFARPAYAQPVIRPTPDSVLK